MASEIVPGVMKSYKTSSSNSSIADSDPVKNFPNLFLNENCMSVGYVIEKVAIIIF
jgi:hypothetical protein